MLIEVEVVHVQVQVVCGVEVWGHLTLPSRYYVYCYHP